MMTVVVLRIYYLVRVFVLQDPAPEAMAHICAAVAAAVVADVHSPVQSQHELAAWNKNKLVAFVEIALVFQLDQNLLSYK